MTRRGFGPQADRVRLLATVMVLGASLWTSVAWATEAEVVDLVGQVAERVLTAVRQDPECRVDLERLRLRLVIATTGEAAMNASASAMAFSERTQAPVEGRIVCWPYRSLTGKAGYGKPSSGGRANSWDLDLVIGSELVSEICEMKPERVAFLLGHETAHATLGHITRPKTGEQDMLILAALTKEMEFAADRKGIEYAAQAGYDDALAAAGDVWRVMTAKLGVAVPLEPQAAFSEHPTDTERIAAVQSDPAKKQFWRDLTSFDNGVLYLNLADWLAAQQCFEIARRSFPEAPEVIGNAGYAKMMRYYSSITAAERRKIRGEVSCLSYSTKRPAIHGGVETDKTPLLQAIADARQVIALAPDYYQGRILLGTALVLDPDAEPAQLREAAEVLTAAAVSAEHANDLSARVDALSNAALAQCRLQPEAGAQPLRLAYSQLGAPAQALCLNLGVALASSAAVPDQQEAQKVLTWYLGQAPSGTYYYQCAAQAWTAVARVLKVPADHLPEPQTPQWLTPRSVQLPDGSLLYLQQPWEKAEKTLSAWPGTTVPITGLADGFIYDCAELGLQSRVSRGVLRMMLLSTASAPAVSLPSAGGVAGPTLELKIGASEPALCSQDGRKPLKWDDLGMAIGELVISKRRFTMYDSGVALSFDKQGKISAIVLISG
ncbi:MAG: M48 family metalloprotease [Armatimonadota bacterium]